MSKIAILFLTIFVFGFVGAANIFSQTADPLEEANQLYAGKKYEQAVVAYQDLLAKFSDAPTRAKIIFNLGMTYQQLRQYDKAVETFTRIFGMSVDDREPGGNLMEAYRNYRSRAQWEIGNSLFAAGDYAGALVAYRTTHEEYPFKTWCGTCRASIEYKYALYEAICLEHLGRYDEAVAAYLKFYHPRLAELYETNGQLDDLKQIIARRDAPLIADYQKKYAWTPEKIAESLSSRGLNEVIKIYELEKTNNITALMNLASQFAKGGGDDRQEAVARMLARHPRQTAPLIEGTLRRDNYLPAFYYRILSRAGTPEAIAILKQQAEKATNSWDAMALIENLSSAGELGENALKELEGKNLSENMRFFLRKYRSGEPINEASEKISFPPVPQTKLPTEL